MRRTEDTGQRQLEPKIAKARAISYERHLTGLGIEPKDYHTVYELAVKIRVEEGIRGPFGIDDIIKGVNRFLSVPSLPKKFVKPVKERTECSTCNGTGLQFDTYGKIVYETQEGKKKAAHCLDCYAR